VLVVPMNNLFFGCAYSALTWLIIRGMMIDLHTNSLWRRYFYADQSRLVNFALVLHTELQMALARLYQDMRGFMENSHSIVYLGVGLQFFYYKSGN
jgi:hypothetical protein